MYAGIRSVRVHPGTAAKVGELTQAGYVPLIAGLDGFVEFYMFESGEDEVTTISLFETEAGVDAANAAAKEWVPANLGEYIAAPLAVKKGRAVAHARK